MAEKPKSNSKLMQLPPHQREQLIHWLVEENLSYEKAAERVETDFGVRTSESALTRFYRSQCFALRSSEAKACAELISQEVQKINPNFDEATMALVRQKAFEQAYARNGDIKELALLARIIGDRRKQKLKEKELDLKREKFVHQIKTDLERGLDALAIDVKGNAEAMQLFEKMRALILQIGEDSAVSNASATSP